MATDQEIRDAGYKYIPQQKYLLNPFQIPTTDEPVTDEGIVNTNAFVGGGGGDDFNPAGNIFGEGTAVKPVFGNSYIDTVRREGINSLPAYEKLIQAGGTAPGGMYATDYFPGTENELVDAMGRTFGQPGYDPNMDMSEDAFQKAEDKRGFLSRLINNAKQGYAKLPSWAQSAISTAGLVNPFTAIPKLFGMSGGDGGPSYGIAGLNDEQKAMYDALASQGMLFSTPGGYKSLTGKNIMGKGYLEGQISNYNDMVGAGYKMDSSGNVYNPDGELVSGYLESKFKEASNVFGQNEKTEEEKYQDRIDSFVKNYNKPGTEEMFDTVYDGTNIHGGDGTTGGTTTTTNNDGGNGGGIDISGAGTVRSAGNNFEGDSGPTTQQESDYGYASDFGFARGGLASIL